LEGTWGLVIMSKDDPNQIIAARNGSPLVVGVDRNRMFVASEVSAFSRHTKEFIALKDKEIAVIRGDGGSLDLGRVEKAAHEEIEISPSPYPHWTIKEIMEQPAAVSRTLHYGGRFSEDGNRVKLGGLEEKIDLLSEVQNLILSACGTSYFAALYGALVMRDLKAFETVQVFDASEVTNNYFPAQGGGLCVLSQSGETKDTHRALKLAEDLNIPRFSVVNKVGSLIARTTNCGVYLYAGHEHAVASTKAFTTQVTALALIAGWFAQMRDPTGRFSQTRQELLNSVHRLPIYVGMALQAAPRCKEVAQKLKNTEHLFVLGKGYGEPIAREGALKIKEITYIHAEGYGGGALKHGPFALLDQGTPVIMLIFDDEHAELMKIAAQEVRARGTYNIVITDKPALVKDIADDIIQIPSNGPMTALLGVIPLQLLAYELAVARGIDPDKPKNLAKAVTVD